MLATCGSGRIAPWPCPDPPRPKTRRALALAHRRAVGLEPRRADAPPAEQLGQQLGWTSADEEGFHRPGSREKCRALLTSSCSTAMERGNDADAAHFGDDAIRHFRRSGNTPWVSQALIDAGLGASLSGDDVRATALREEGLALCRDVGNVWGLWRFGRVTRGPRRRMTVMSPPRSGTTEEALSD